VIAAIDGGPMQQTWLSVGRALAAATSVAAPGGAIVLCSDLAVPPGPALNTLGHPGGPEAAARELRKMKSFDAWPAAVLHAALAQHQVYLLSRLDRDSVEELGLACVAAPDEVCRLAKAAESCAVLVSAQHAAPRVAGE
jgi:hypothetical protein